MHLYPRQRDRWYKKSVPMGVKRFFRIVVSLEFFIEKKPPNQPNFCARGSKKVDTSRYKQRLQG